MQIPAGVPVPTRILGRTGERVSAIGLGGFHIGRPDLTEAESIRIIRTAIDNGITFLDNCWDYNDGLSEIRMGRALRDGYRERAFLMTKIDGRDRKSAADQIDESLRRLQTDRIDLLQFHEIIHENDPERIFAEGGALEAVLEAQRRREDPLYRVHRAQEPGHPHKDARDGGPPSLPVRHGPDAPERDGRPFRELRAGRSCRPSQGTGSACSG